MAEFFVMPQSSPTMEVGKLVGWTVKEGDSLNPQDVIAEVETDKATMEIEVFDPCVVLKILHPAGAEVPVFDPIAIIGKSADEDISDLLTKLAAGSPAPAQSEPAPEAAPIVNEAPSPVSAPAKAGPAARKAANELGVNLQDVKGSGRGGRVLREDVERAIKQAGGVESFAWEGQSVDSSIMEPIIGFVPNKAYPKRRGRAGVAKAEAAPESNAVPNSMMRKTIAKRLKASYLDAPTFFLNARFDCDKLVAFRTQLKEAGLKVSYNDLVVKAVGKALQDVPKVNASWTEDAILVHPNIDIGVAVALPDGLITPVVRGVDGKGLAAISSSTRELIGRAKDGKLQPDEYMNSTFTISNLGMMAIEHFTAIINPPNSAILAVGSMQQEPVVVGGTLSVGWRMKVTMTCDHRVIDGALGAEFLLAVRKYIENPALLAA
ncbi:MAG: dihydrolipoamide acetyltransferase family protein [Myxococcota bacterium]|nr:dihydrolipoamide acetyltransferase family protein [Myxococcota bacterium]